MLVVQRVRVMTNMCIEGEMFPFNGMLGINEKSCSELRGTDGK